MTDPTANPSEPILTEIHDEVVEVIPPPGGQKPIWTDEVDELYEFTDDTDDASDRAVPAAE